MGSWDDMGFIEEESEGERGQKDSKKIQTTDFLKEWADPLEEFNS